MSLLIIARAVYDSVRVCGVSTVDGWFGDVPADRSSRRLNGWASCIVKAAAIDLRVKGREHIVPGEPYVVMSNHQSMYDIVVLFEAVGLGLRMIAKKDLFKIPIFGTGMAAAEIIPLDRTNRRKAMQSLEMAERLLERGLSVWISPEGTRSLDKQLLPFKRGGFHLAVNAKARILPVSIEGTWEVMRPNQKSIRKGLPVTVTIHPPVDCKSYGKQRMEQLVDEVRARIASGLPQESATPAKEPPAADATS